MPRLIYVAAQLKCLRQELEMKLGKSIKTTRFRYGSRVLITSHIRLSTFDLSLEGFFRLSLRGANTPKPSMAA